MEVKIAKVKPIRVAFMRHVGPYEKCGETWGKFCAWAGPRGLLGPQTTVIGISHDDPEVTPPEKIRYDACITVDENFEPEGEVGVQEIKGGDYAVVVNNDPAIGARGRGIDQREEQEQRHCDTLCDIPAFHLSPPAVPGFAHSPSEVR